MAGTSPRTFGRWLLAAAPLLAACVTGCSDAYPSDLTYLPRTDRLVIELPKKADIANPDPPGHLDDLIASIGNDPALEGGKTLDPTDPKKLNRKQRATLESVLSTCFGTPAAPRVDLPVDDPGRAELQDAVETLRLDEQSLASGSKLYRRHCLHCHGLDGDGRGPSGAWLNPHPRDYRRGIFKYASTTASPTKPSRDDLYRVLQRGIEGSAMPAFNQLSNGEIHDLVSYVIHLSLRGETEFDTLRELLSKGEVEGGIKGFARSDLKDLIKFWLASNGATVKPTVEVPSDERSIRRGYELYALKKNESLGFNCYTCHLDFGRQAHYRFDEWGTLVRPRDLTAGTYRGGRRPIDLFNRLRVGIPGSGMPAFNKQPEKDVWDVVNFVHALPYPGMLPADIRERIYGTAGTAWKAE